MSDAPMPPPGEGMPGDPAPPPPPPPNWGAPPPPSSYAQPPQYGASGGYSGGGQLAEWPQRALGGLIDYFGGAIIAAFVQIAISGTLGLFLSLVNAAWALYNGYLNGQTGKSVGKQVVGLKVVRATDGQLIGGGLGVVRALAHIVDSIICYIGFLFPLWDSKKQTLADKIMSTVVVVDKT